MAERSAVWTAVSWQGPMDSEKRKGRRGKREELKESPFKLEPV